MVRIRRNSFSQSSQMKPRDTRSSEAGRPACLAGGESPWCGLHPTHEQLASPHMPPQGPEGARLEIKNTAISTVFITLRCPPGWDKHRQVRDPKEMKTEVHLLGESLRTIQNPCLCDVLLPNLPGPRTWGNDPLKKQKA